MAPPMAPRPQSAPLHSVFRVEIVKLPADVLDLVPRFLANRCSDVGRLHEAVAARDYEKVRSIGHRMIGSGGGYGFAALADIGYALERAATDERVHTIAELTIELEEYLACVRVVPDEG